MYQEPKAGFGLFAFPRSKKSMSDTNVPLTYGQLELPLTPGAVVLMDKAAVVVDVEAGRGGAPNDQGIVFNVRG